MAELHHWMHSWPNAGGRSHRAEFLGLVTSSALSSLWHWQKPVVWMGVLIVSCKVSVPIFRVHWTWTGWMPKVVFAISSSAIVSWPGNSGSRWPHLTSPHRCKTGMLSIFPLPEPPHKSSTGFWLPRSLQGEMLVRGSHDETSSCAGNCQCQCSWVEWISWQGFCWVLILSLQGTVNAWLPSVGLYFLQHMFPSMPWTDAEPVTLITLKAFSWFGVTDSIAKDQFILKAKY